jgi:hypothetical protein
LIRPLVFTSLLSLGGGGWEKLANACLCLEPPPPIEAYKSSSAVFIGTVVSGRLEGDSARRYEFRVEESLKGKLNDNVEVFTGRGGGDCGYNFEIGGKYLVYAGNFQEKLGTSICTRTKPYDFAGYNSRGEEERGKTEAEELKAKLHSDLYGDEQKTNAVVDLSGEWQFNAGYVFGGISLVQSNNHLSGTASTTTDTLQHGKSKIEGEIHYPKVILIFYGSAEFVPTNEYLVVRWKDGKQYYMKATSKDADDLLRPGMN